MNQLVDEWVLKIITGRDAIRLVLEMLRSKEWKSSGGTQVAAEYAESINV